MTQNSTSQISPLAIPITLSLEKAVSILSDGTSTYTWTQAIPLPVWTIAHNLNRHPSVTVVDTTGAKIEADVSYIDSTTIQITFGAAFAGKAYLN